MLLLNQLAEWLRARAERGCPHHHWHPDQRGWTCCWGGHTIRAGRNTTTPEHTTRLCDAATAPADALESWLRDIQPGQHRRPLLPTLSRRRMRQPTT